MVIVGTAEKLFNMSIRKKILITGASGLLGANLVRHYAPKSNCTGWYATNPIHFEDAKTEQIDLIEHSSVAHALRRIQPEIIIHCASASEVDWNENNPTQSKAINEDVPKFLAKESIGLRSKFIFISSPFIFNGKEGNYREGDTPGPLNTYARGKLNAEISILKSNPNSLIIRACFYGYSPSGNHSILEWILGQASKNQKIPGFTDSYFSPINVYDLAECLDSAISSNVKGILHLGSINTVSKYEFIRMVLHNYGYRRDLLKPITVDGASLHVRRPRDSSLDISLFQKILRVPARTVVDGLDRFTSKPNPFTPPP